MLFESVSNAALFTTAYCKVLMQEWLCQTQHLEWQGLEGFVINGLKDYIVFQA